MIRMMGMAPTRIQSMRLLPTRIAHRWNSSLPELAAELMKQEFRSYGHLETQLSPLEVAKSEHNDQPRLQHSQLREDRFDALFTSPKGEEYRSLYQSLSDTYCNKLGLEVAHISNVEEKAWLAAEMEAPRASLSPAIQRNAFTKMKMAEVFEHFLAKKFPSFKRYSGEGSESLMPALDRLFQLSAESEGIDEIVIGMPHRGRLALMVSLLDYPAHKLFWKIQGNSDYPQGLAQGIDDVTSHLATSAVKTYGEASVKVSLLHNPSHLEIINAVATGKTRAKQQAGTNSLCLLMHGDAAFSGQGVVPEGLALSQLPDYQTGGTIHLIVNNQIGFTTTATHGRSSRYCSDVAKSIEAPILHVNGECMDSVMSAVSLALRYRQTFGKDVVLDLQSYRRHGHNEVDEPAFTQPTMYASIRSRESFPSLYGTSLTRASVFSTEKINTLSQTLEAHMESEFQHVKKYVPSELNAFALDSPWEKMGLPTGADLFADAPTLTGIATTEELREIGLASVTVPESFQPHDRLMRTHLKARRKLLAATTRDSEAVIDWATAEALAFGTLLREGTSIRLAGQDCKRGTFSQRHAVLTDQQTDATHSPLATLTGVPSNVSFNVVNSNLSELAVMAFEYGFSWDSPSNLVLWEAQFGDFNNGAQIVIDQFIASGESKWMRQSGLVLLLPHGYDGAGPDHSSAKIERFLQLVDSHAWGPRTGPLKARAAQPFDQYCSNVNMAVVNVTTAANYFHVLRRQQHRAFRKPLIVISPKTLLRSPDAASSLAEMGPGTSFQPLLEDTSVPSTASTAKRKAIKTVYFCSGKLYYDLEKARAMTEAEGDAETTTVIVRLEELSPFPFAQVTRQLAAYEQATTVAWVQEEPVNQGAWSYVQAHLTKCFKKKSTTLGYIGRPALPASAVGLSKDSAKQMQNIISTAFPDK